MNNIPFSETLVESSNIFKVKKVKVDVSGDMKISGHCTVDVNVSDLTIVENSGRRLILPYRLIEDQKTIQPVFGADGYSGKVKYPDGKAFKFKLTFPNGGFPRFMDSVVPSVITARHNAKKAAKRQAVVEQTQARSVGYVNPNNAGVVYVPVQPAPAPGAYQYAPAPQQGPIYYAPPSQPMPQNISAPIAYGTLNDVPVAMNSEISPVLPPPMPETTQLPTQVQPSQGNGVMGNNPYEIPFSPYDTNDREGGN